jgi:hypothetical protein
MRVVRAERIPDFAEPVIGPRASAVPLAASGPRFNGMMEDMR